MSQPTIMSGKLPAKEQGLFRTLVGCYEQKQYKKGVKTADTILKKCPNHGETLAMKGLVMNCMNKKTEAYELVKSGLRNDVRSHICWHVFGLLHRSDNNYKEAIKCYQNALKIDTENSNILRDLSWLQVQMRDMPGFVETRKKLLDGKPSLRQNWITFAVANFVNGQYKATLEVIKKYRETITKKDQLEGYEESELRLFQNKCFELDGRLTEALSDLEASKADIVDKHSYNIKHAELLLKLGRYEEAKTEWLTLIVNHPENYRFHSGFQAAHLQLSQEQITATLALQRLALPSTEFNLTSEQLASLRAAYDETKIKPKLLRRLQLSLYRSSDAGFQEHLSSYIQAGLKDGLPALYHDVCALFRIPDAANPSRLVFTKDSFELSQHPVYQFVSDLIQTFIRNLKEHQQFHAPSASTAGELPELPSALLWSLYLHCHLLELKGDLAGALKVIDECIAHTPTGIDMYSKKARLLKKQGDLVGAAVQMDECRALDLQDRYLNNKTTKYFLRADEMNQAMNTIAMFTKHEGDPQKTLYDLQCNWYELEAGESYARSKQWGQALKKFYAVKKHFNDHFDDMFDFHGYCIRKNTLRAYNDILIMQDNAYTHKFYQRAARGVLRIFLHLLECPEDIDGLGHLTPADRKKERAKVKKQKDKEKKEAEDKLKAEEEDKKWNSNPNKAQEEEEEAEAKKDPDPTGELLLTRDFQAEAAVWCGFFTDRMSGLDSETLALVCEIQMRRGKYLQVVRALSVGLKKDPLHPELNVMLVKVVLKMKAPSGKRPVLQATTAVIVREELSALLSSTDGLALGAFVTKYAEKCKELNSLPHTIGAARCLYLNDKSAPTVQAIASMINDSTIWSGRGIHFTVVADALKVLQSTWPTESFVEEFKTHAIARYPAATIFQSSEKVAAVAAAAAAASNGTSADASGSSEVLLDK